jgi:predicted Zn-dependent protease
MLHRWLSLVALLPLACGGAARHAESAIGEGIRLPEAPKKLDVTKPRADGASEKAKVLGVLEAELARNFSELQKRGDPKPYFLSYEAIDQQSATIEGSFGTLVSSDEDRWRSLDVDVRVGSPKLDNTHRLRGDAGSTTHDFTHSAWLPTDDDALATRSIAWLTTDVEYRKAVEELVRVRENQRVLVDEEDDSGDFSTEKPSQFHEKPAAFSVDRAAWEENVRKWSKPFSEHPDLFESSVTFETTAETRYFANSEGSSVQVARSHARVDLTGRTTADDGMELERTEAFDAETPERLPAPAAIEAAAQKVVLDLEALRKAPTIDPYAGPAILDGRAAAVFFHEIFGHRVEGHRQKDEEEGQTFARKVGEPVMPSFLDVFDDPGLGALNGVPLNGYYPFDDEGISGQRASLVSGGVLRGFLLSRSPVHGFPNSNGHGRREHGRRVVARQSNLVVDPAYTTSPEALKQRLIDEIVRQHRAFGLRFHEITGGYTNTTRQGAQAFKVLPVMVYRIYPDGHEELVRGADLEGTPLAALSRIEAAANDFETFNGVCGAESGWVPVSATSPSLLISQIEVTRREKSDDRPPLLPSPAPPAHGVKRR